MASFSDLLIGTFLKTPPFDIEVVRHWPAEVKIKGFGRLHILHLLL